MNFLYIIISLVILYKNIKVKLSKNQVYEIFYL